MSTRLSCILRSKHLSPRKKTRATGCWSSQRNFQSFFFQVRSSRVYRLPISLEFFPEEVLIRSPSHSWIEFRIKDPSSSSSFFCFKFFKLSSFWMIRCRGKRLEFGNVRCSLSIWRNFYRVKNEDLVSLLFFFEEKIIQIGERVFLFYAVPEEVLIRSLSHSWIEFRIKDPSSFSSCFKFFKLSSFWMIRWRGKRFECWKQLEFGN